MVVILTLIQILQNSRSLVNLYQDLIFSKTSVVRQEDAHWEMYFIHALIPTSFVACNISIYYSRERSISIAAS